MNAPKELTSNVTGSFVVTVVCALMTIGLVLMAFIEIDDCRKAKTKREKIAIIGKCIFYASMISIFVIGAVASGYRFINYRKAALEYSAGRRVIISCIVPQEIELSEIEDALKEYGVTDFKVETEYTVYQPGT